MVKHRSCAEQSDLPTAQSATLAANLAGRSWRKQLLEKRDPTVCYQRLVANIGANGRHPIMSPTTTTQ